MIYKINKIGQDRNNFFIKQTMKRASMFFFL